MPGTFNSQLHIPSVPAPVYTTMAANRLTFGGADDGRYNRIQVDSMGRFVVRRHGVDAMSPPPPPYRRPFPRTLRQTQIRRVNIYGNVTPEEPPVYTKETTRTSAIVCTNSCNSFPMKRHIFYFLLTLYP